MEAPKVEQLDFLLVCESVCLYWLLLEFTLFFFFVLQVHNFEACVQNIPALINIQHFRLYQLVFKFPVFLGYRLPAGVFAGDPNLRRRGFLGVYIVSD